jgi:spore coat polysaccharide biosynthesis protein SpsF (cytidylyltransferase family)
MKTAFIICSRLESSRVPKKAITPINGVPVLVHLINRIAPTGIPIVLAIPIEQQAEYEHALKDCQTPVTYYFGHPEDPLARMSRAAEVAGVENVIRITHDKIFVSHEQVTKLLDIYFKRSLDYVYSSKFTDGTAFEIISAKALKQAAEKFKGVEYISYAVRSITDNVFDCASDGICEHSNIRLLIDYPSDVKLLEVLFSHLGNDCTFDDVVAFLEKNPWALKINALPKVTLYTCAYNAAKFIERCMGSVAKQKRFREWEYIIIDDHSTDDTTRLVAKFCTLFPNARWIRNKTNLGLATSSNIALKEAKGKFIMRLDADDYFPRPDAVDQLLSEIEATSKDVIVPNNYFGSLSKIQKGKDAMHVGGSMFRTRAINYLKFTDGLRNYEGLDLFTRGRDVLKVGYLNKPIFMYSQRGDSMSKTNLAEREETRKKILAGTLEAQP